VANDPSPDQAAVLGPGSRDLDPIAGRAPEVTWTSTPLGSAAARNVGLRRASGEIVVLADPSIELTGDALAPLEVVLEDPRVAVAGAFGLVTADFRHFSDAPGPAVDVIGGEWLAFRRDDYRRLGPLDEQFLSPRSLDAWWSLVLRAGPDPAAPPREARRLDLPLLRSADAPSLASTDLGTDRLAKRNYSRLLDRFREQAGDLLLAPRAPRA
jgi:hypothetical protein